MTRFAPSPASPAAEPADLSKAARLLSEHLFYDPDMRAYAVLDGAAAKGLLELVRKHNPPHYCLYRGELPPDVAEVAPYLVELRQDDPVTQAILAQGWGQHWGIFVRTPADVRAMRQHFRSFVMVTGPDGRPLYFRFYDPRVLRAFMPTCNRREAATLFGPVRSYLLEAEDGSILRLRLHDASRLPVAEAVNRPPHVNGDVPQAAGDASGEGRGGQY